MRFENYPSDLTRRHMREVSDNQLRGCNRTVCQKVQTAARCWLRWALRCKLGRHHHCLPYCPCYKESQEGNGETAETTTRQAGNRDMYLTATLVLCFAPPCCRCSNAIKATLAPSANTDVDKVDTVAALREQPRKRAEHDPSPVSRRIRGSCRLRRRCCSAAGSSSSLLQRRLHRRNGGIEHLGHLGRKLFEDGILVGVPAQAQSFNLCGAWRGVPCAHAAMGSFKCNVRQRYNSCPSPLHVWKQLADATSQTARLLPALLSQPLANRPRPQTAHLLTAIVFWHLFDLLHRRFDGFCDVIHGWWKCTHTQ